jgi:hypothetical protein
MAGLPLDARSALAASLLTVLCGLALLTPAGAMATQTHARGAHCVKHKDRRCMPKRKRAKHPGGASHKPSTSPNANRPDVERPLPPIHGRSQPCAASVKPALPPGYGWVTGGIYFSGGPPQNDADNDCGAASADVVVSDSNGNTVASQQVGHGESWAIALPQGTYSLKAYYQPGTALFCPGEPPTFSVLVGQAVSDNAACDVP